MVSVLKGLLYSSLSSVDVLCNQYVIVHMLRNVLCCFSLNYTILGVLHFYFESIYMYFFFMLFLSQHWFSVTMAHLKK